jgi:LysR family transcriptional regulator, regulator for metE and metH
LPRWLADEYADRMPVASVKLGRDGIAKQIFLGTRETDASIDYLHAFVELARSANAGVPRLRV